MPFSTIPAAVIPLTSDGTTTGTITVSVLTVPTIGTKGWLYSSAAGSIPVEVASADTTTGVVGLRLLAPWNSDLPLPSENLGTRLTYGMCGTLAAWKVADGATFQVERQDIKTQPLYRSAQ